VHLACLFLLSLWVGDWAPGFRKRPRIDLLLHGLTAQPCILDSPEMLFKGFHIATVGRQEMVDQPVELLLLHPAALENIKSASKVND
jgi:hypothetical protein